MSFRMWLELTCACLSLGSLSHHPIIPWTSTWSQTSHRRFTWIHWYTMLHLSLLGLKQYHKPAIWKWFIRPIKMVMTGGWFIALFYQHYIIFSRSPADCFFFPSQTELHETRAVGVSWNMLIACRWPPQFSMEWKSSTKALPRGSTLWLFNIAMV
jgi:hypothetical protein